MLKREIPKRLQSVLWSVDVNSLDINEDKQYIIHQVLMRGSLDDLKWLFTMYSREEIQTLFYRHPTKIYPLRVFYFVKNFVLNLHREVDEHNYVTSIFGPIRQRTTKNISLS